MSSAGTITASADDAERVLAQHGRWLRTVLLARSGEPAAVDELFQEMVVNVLKTPAERWPISQVTAWLYTIAVRIALLHRRKCGRRRRLISRVQTTVDFSPRSSDPLSFLLAAERQQMVRTAMGRLLPKERELLLLKYSEGWSYDEIAEHLGLSPGQVSTQLYRARGKLRGILLQPQFCEVTR